MQASDVGRFWGAHTMEGCHRPWARTGIGLGGLHIDIDHGIHLESILP